MAEAVCIHCGQMLHGVRLAVGTVAWASVAPYDPNRTLCMSSPDSWHHAGGEA